ncbi:MAG: hypothetical protein JSS51_03460 [Planctomycetes bacterium]|nr:hypothetical protein [Planctomycetota bacterium]
MIVHDYRTGEAVVLNNNRVVSAARAAGSAGKDTDSSIKMSTGEHIRVRESLEQIEKLLNGDGVEEGGVEGIKASRHQGIEG